MSDGLMDDLEYGLKFNRASLEDDNKFRQDTQAELARARTKFPSSNLSLAALMEEVGELAQAMLKVRAGKLPSGEVWKEAIQVAAMAQRVAVEGDRSFLVEYNEP